MQQEPANELGGVQSHDLGLRLLAAVLPLVVDVAVGKVPLGATAFALHDAVDQAVVPLLPGFPYLFTPIPGSQ